MRTLAILLLLCVPAQGADWLAVGMVAARGADIGVTEYAIHELDAREANPLLRDQAVRIALQAAGTTALVYTYHRLKKTSRTKAIILAVGSIVVWVGFTALNLYRIHTRPR